MYGLLIESKGTRAQMVAEEGAGKLRFELYNFHVYLQNENCLVKQYSNKNAGQKQVAERHGRKVENYVPTQLLCSESS